MHILVVEDDKFLRRALERWFKQHGHTMFWASNGPGAIRLLCSEGTSLDLIVLDMMLEVGGMTGWDVARFIYFDQVLRKIPLVVMSGLSTQEIHAGARVNVLEDVALVLSKPMDMRLLEKLLDNLEPRFK